METSSPKQHPDAAGVWTVSNLASVTPLMRRSDVDVVILERPHLRSSYASLFNVRTDLFDHWYVACGATKRYAGMEITMPDHASALLTEPSSVKVDHYNHLQEMKAAGLPDIWDDFAMMAAKIAELSGQRTINGRLFQQMPWQKVYNDELTRNFHHHGRKDDERRDVTAHMSTTDAALEIVLGYTADSLACSTGNLTYKNDEIPKDAKILKTMGADIVLFKPPVIHRKSPDSLTVGRSALSIYAAYLPGMPY